MPYEVQQLTTAVTAKDQKLKRPITIHVNYPVDKESVARIGVDDVNPLVGKLVERESLRQALLQKGGNLRDDLIERIPPNEVDKGGKVLLSAT